MPPAAACSIRETVLLDSIKGTYHGEQQDIKEEIAKVAYEIYEQRGSSSLDMENWLEAERVVLERLSARDPSKAAKKLSPSRKKDGTTKKKKCREQGADNFLRQNVIYRPLT